MKGKGSMTIEATFIIPICFLAMIAFLYMAMYLHDCYVIETIIRTAAQREMRYVLQDEKVEEGTIDWKYWREKTIIWSLTANLQEETNDLKQYIRKSLDGKLFLSEQPSLTIEMNTDKIVVLYASKVQWPMNFLKKWIAGKSDIVGTVHIVGIEPQEWIRMCRGFLSSSRDERKQ